MGGFYEDQPNDVLRLGDIITGFQVVTALIHQPATETASWTIAVERPRYLAVMTPCCSIERKSVVLAPLVSVLPSFLKNPYFEGDLTRINRKTEPEKSVSPEMWENILSEEYKEKMLAIGLAYAFQSFFIYDKHELLPQYQLNCKPPKRTGYYMVDFKSMCRINCDLIDRDKPSPPNTKILQLSVPTREDLRSKLAEYYARIPEEDEPML